MSTETVQYLKMCAATEQFIHETGSHYETVTQTGKIIYLTTIKGYNMQIHISDVLKTIETHYFDPTHGDILLQQHKF